MTTTILKRRPSRAADRIRSTRAAPIMLTTVLLCSVAVMKLQRDTGQGPQGSRCLETILLLDERPERLTTDSRYKCSGWPLG